LWTAVAALCLGSIAWGQGAEADYVTGEVRVDQPLGLRGAVTLRDCERRLPFMEVEVGGDGRFEFRRVPYGQYLLTVLDDAGRPVHQETVSVNGQPRPILVEVTRRETARPPSGPVSAAQLLHPPTKKALQAFQTARKFAEKGAHDKAAEELARAVALSPDYADAWIDLGAQHLFLGRYDQALQELARAGEIVKPNAVILGDMAFAEYSLRRYGEGVRLARQALRLDPSYAPAHYLLGSFLVLDRRTLAEGLQHLEAAALSMPVARAALERAR